jgi:hypothetical protein
MRKIQPSTKEGVYYNTRIYSIWLNMKARCCNPNNPGYHNYGGRGIKICEEWHNSFQSFRKWAFDNGYTDNLTIDRINNNKGYFPENCRWISNLKQQSNRNNNIKISFKGKTKTISEWAREKNMSFNMLRHRLNSGINIEKALHLPHKDKLHDITGKRFGRLIALRLHHIDNRKTPYWECKCDCGNIKIIRKSNLVLGYTKSCGCLQKEKASKMMHSRKFEKPIIQFNLNGIFIADYKSPIEAHRKTGISKSCIVLVANKTEYKPGKIRKQAGGFIWRYKKEVI